MGAFVGGNLGGEGIDFGLLDFIPPAETITGSSAYFSSDGGEYLKLESPSATFGLTIPYAVTFIAADTTRYASPVVKVASRTALVAVVPQMPLGTYDVELAVDNIDSSTVEDMVKVLKRSYFTKTHNIRDGLLSKWSTGAQRTADEQDTLVTEEYNFAQLTAATGELLEAIDSYSPNGHSVVATAYSRGDTTLSLRSVYPFVSAGAGAPGQFSIRKGVVYSYTGFDDSTNELTGVTIVTGEDRDLPVGTPVYPLVQ